MTTETLVCPICKSNAKPLDIVGDYIGFECTKHDKFKVARTVFAGEYEKNKSSQQWEAALRKAKERAKDGAWPLIQTYDF